MMKLTLSYLDLPSERIAFCQSAFEPSYLLLIRETPAGLSATRVPLADVENTLRVALRGLPDGMSAAS